MSKVFYIYENKRVVYTHKVYAKSKAEALRKYKDSSAQHCEEIGLDPAGNARLTVEERGEATDNCAACGKRYSPENVRDYLCNLCDAGDRRKKTT